VLAFAKDVVSTALANVQEGSGSDYLEKVVQVPFEIPLISKQEVEKRECFMMIFCYCSINISR